MKDEAEVVKEFNEIVNMTADELEAFLKTGDSENTGFAKSDGSGESIGHESGRKIVDILKRNPDKDESKYTDEDKAHMRKVVSYCKRHLAQEEHMKEEKTPEELEKTKSTRSLKNWGHDPLKTLKGGKPASKKASDAKPKSSGKTASKKDEKPKPTGKPASKKEEKPKSTAKPISKKEEKPKSSGKPASKKEDKTAEAEAGGKRAAETAPTEKAESKKTEKPASKKAKTTKEPTEGTRKPPSRNAKK